MKVLILGGQGMLGHKLFQRLHPHHKTFATFQNRDSLWMHFPMYQDQSYTISGVNALHFDSVIQAVTGVKPDVVVNCIGVIKQLDAAHNSLLSIELNALFPHRLAQLCQIANIRLIHISTDCVFSGKKGNYREADIPDATDMYGLTKLLGEVTYPGCLTIRTSLIGRDFVKNVGLLEWFLSNEGKRVKGFSQAIFSGFTTLALANIIRQVIEQYTNLVGMYHIASEPISKYTLLQKIQQVLHLNIEIEETADFHCDRSLNGQQFTTTTGCHIPSWQTMITELANDPTPYTQWKKQHGTA